MQFPALIPKADRLMQFPALIPKADRLMQFPALIPKADRLLQFPTLIPKADRLMQFPALISKAEPPGKNAETRLYTRVVLLSHTNLDGSDKARLMSTNTRTYSCG